MYQLKITIPGLPKTTNGNARAHWRRLQQQAKTWQRATLLAIGSQRPIAPLKRARLVLTRHSSREPDFDGLVSSFKHCVDSLVKAGVIIDDKMSVIGQPDYRWQRAPMRGGFVTIEVSEIATDRPSQIAQGCAL